MSDQLEKFLFNQLNVRGEYLRLESAWQEILARRSYPKNVQILLGELVAAVALLAGSIKRDGKITAQIQSSGDISLMVVQLNPQGGLRALAKHLENPTGEDLKTLCGEGQLIISIESAHSSVPYQGVIPLLNDARIQTVLERYFESSEQLLTRLELAANEASVAGLFIQKLPAPTNALNHLAINQTEDDEDGFSRIGHLSATITKKELLNDTFDVLLKKLFHEEELAIFEPQTIYFECGCSRKRTFLMLNQFTETELKEMLLENHGKITVDCQFCGKSYHFDDIDIKAAGYETSTTQH